MNADEMSWLLQTIGDPETAKTFVQAQYEYGRIGYRMIADLAREHGLDRLPGDSSMERHCYFEGLRS